MKKVWNAVAKDLWTVLLDIIAVNAAYFLALIIRFYVGGFLRPVAVNRYLPAWLSFTPWYTICSLIVFAVFRLYGGMWRYAGINDMNRIILASLTTALLHIAGTSIFFTRMPITYYVIGTVLQFLFVVSIRFGYRVLLVEKQRLRRGKRINTVVVGSGENGRRVVKNLEESELYQPVAVVGSGSGTMDGIPIMNTLNMENVGAVFIADPLLSSSKRMEIKEKCGDKVEFHDYTGYFSNLGGRLSLTELLSTIHGPVTIEVDGEEKVYEDGTAALRALTDKYEVKEITGQKIKIKLNLGRVISTQETLAEAYAAVMGDELPQGGSR